MISALPVSHLIDMENYSSIPGIKALEYKEPQPVLTDTVESLFHSNNGVVQSDFIDYFDSIKDYLAENRFKVFSFDLGPASEKVEVIDYYYSAVGRVLSADELKGIIGERLRYVKERFSGIVALENLNYFPTSSYSHVCEAEFISSVIRDNDVYMVLDIAHAVITAKNIDMDIYEYLSALPLERVVEVHISAPGVIDSQWRDLHGRPGSEEYEILEFLLARIKPNPYVVVECYKSFSDIVESYRELGGQGW